MPVLLVTVGEVTGVTYLDSCMYVVCAGCNTVWSYRAETYELLEQELKVVGMTDPTDIVTCRVDRQLYIADADKLQGAPCIWRIGAQFVA